MPHTVVEGFVAAGVSVLMRMMESLSDVRVTLGRQTLLKAAVWSTPGSTELASAQVNCLA